jgi:hypothetical protein
VATDSDVLAAARKILQAIGLSETTDLSDALWDVYGSNRVNFVVGSLQTVLCDERILQAKKVKAYSPFSGLMECGHLPTQSLGALVGTDRR